jgi:hypothetical protein
LQDVLHSVFGVAEAHGAVVAEEKRVLHFGVAGGQRRLNTTTVSASHTFSTGMPAIGLEGASVADGFTVSTAPMAGGRSGTNRTKTCGVPIRCRSR